MPTEISNLYYCLLLLQAQAKEVLSRVSRQIQTNANSYMNPDNEGILNNTLRSALCRQQTLTLLQGRAQ